MFKKRKHKLTIVCNGSIYKNERYKRWETIFNQYGFVLAQGGM